MAINSEILIGSHQQDYVRRAINGGELVSYSIFSNPSLAEGYGSLVNIGWNESDTIHAHNHESDHIAFIQSVFDRLDPLLDIDFVEADTSGNSAINIHRSWYNSYYEEIDLLGNGPSNGWGGGTAHYDYDNVDISWIDYYESDPFTDPEKMTIVHEIGHALGLLDLAFNPEWDTYDSIMSYNHPRDLAIQTWFTDADIKAMQSIWGVEDDTVSNPVNTEDGLVGAGLSDAINMNNSFISQAVNIDLSLAISGKSRRSERVKGTQGDDLIADGKGKDRLIGGAGADQFYFSGDEPYKNRTADRVIDFDRKEGDQLVIANEVLGNLAGDPELAIAESKKELKALATEGYELLYLEPKGYLFVDGNGASRGFGARTEGGLIADLPKNTILSESDILIAA